MAKYEILTKHGRTVLENGGTCWDKIETATCNTVDGAKDYAKIQKHKHPAAEIIVRRLPSLDRVFRIKAAD